ncbi:hypothetical protein ACFXDJ_06680 [Streptomyces sp. NPDC059443]|uniref:hypothetical protein n=1 Tax=unclassified Streptomyces TaxID=2593676 RepID=UPI0036AD781C
MAKEVRPVTWLARWVLAPVTTWRANRYMAAHPGTDAETAWRTVRLVNHPYEAHYQRMRDTKD